MIANANPGGNPAFPSRKGEPTVSPYEEARRAWLALMRQCPACIPATQSQCPNPDHTAIHDAFTELIREANHRTTEREGLRQQATRLDADAEAAPPKERADLKYQADVARWFAGGKPSWKSEDAPPESATTKKCTLPHKVSITPNAESVIFLRDKPKRPEHRYCVDRGSTWGRDFLPDGKARTRHFACGKCEPCREWRLDLMVARYLRIAGDSQTVIRYSGFEDVGAAAQSARKQLRRAGGQRIRLLVRNHDYQWDTVLVYNRQLPVDTLNQIERDANRQGLALNVTTGAFSGDALGEILPTNRTAEDANGKAHKLVVFGNWPDWEPCGDYSGSDLMITTDDSCPPTESRPTALERERATMPLPERRALWAQDWIDATPKAPNPGLVDLLLEQAKAGNVADELLQQIREQSGYRGSTAQLMDAVAYLAMATEWQEYLAPTVAWLGYPQDGGA